MRKTAMPLSEVGERIETIRTQKHQSLGQLAVNAKLVYSQLWRIMHGGSKPSRDSLLRICRALDCTTFEAASIFELTDYRAPSTEELYQLKQIIN